MNNGSSEKKENAAPNVVRIIIPREILRLVCVKIGKNPSAPYKSRSYHRSERVNSQADGLNENLFIISYLISSLTYSGSLATGNQQ